MTPPPSFTTAMTLGGGGVVPSGQMLEGLSMTLPSPGRCTEHKRVRLLGVKIRLAISPSGIPLRNCRTYPRSGSSTGTAYTQSFFWNADGWPSVAIQRLPALSKVMLSGEEIGLTRL